MSDVPVGMIERITPELGKWSINTLGYKVVTNQELRLRSDLHGDHMKPKSLLPTEMCLILWPNLSFLICNPGTCVLSFWNLQWVPSCYERDCHIFGCTVGMYAALYIGMCMQHSQLSYQNKILQKFFATLQVCIVYFKSKVWLCLIYTNPLV